LGLLFEVCTVYALGYVFPVSTQFITTCTKVVAPYVKDGTVFIPANLISSDLLPQLACPINHVFLRSESHNVISSLPDAICSSEKNGVMVKLPPPGLYIVRLYCRDGARDVSMRVMSACAGNDLLFFNEGAGCEFLEPVIPIDCRISSMKCQDSRILVTTSGSSAIFKKMKIHAWFCHSFPLGSNFTGPPSTAQCSLCLVLTPDRDSPADASALAPHHAETSSSNTNKDFRALNRFESGLKLGHEPLYILNRKKQKPTWLGVSLPRPSLVSVPAEVSFLYLLYIHGFVEMHYRVQFYSLHVHSAWDCRDRDQECPRRTEVYGGSQAWRDYGHDGTLPSPPIVLAHANAFY
jgi:hypothetical protein